jgi:membrane protein implicated in regulation of membrane protease activity
MIEFPITLVFWHWWIIGVALLGLEMLISGTFFLWMGAAAGVTGALLLIFSDPSWQIQFLIFAVVSVLSIFGWRAWRKTHPPAATDHPHLNQRTEQYVGRIIALDQTLENGRGSILIDCTMWELVAESGVDFPVGAQMRVIGSTGGALTIGPV